MVARVGPTVFTIKNEQDETFRVMLGNPHTCTCGAQEDTCIHKLFCLIKVLKVPVEHSLCYQTSLTDNEMDQVLDGIQTGSTRRPVRTRTIKPVVVVSEELAKDTHVPRQPIIDGEDNTCTICMDDMTPDQALTWCRAGCGQNIHAKCMMKCAQHNITNKLPITCPLCRNHMDLPTLKQDLKGKSSLKHSYAPVQCASCKCHQRGDFFRCVECSQIAVLGSEKPYDYCPECFERQSDPVHYKHHFVQSNIAHETSHGVDWIPSKNPATKGMLMNTELVRELQNRELGVNDYELLLQLSNGGPVPEFPVLCIESLPIYTKGNGGKKATGAHSMCWCAEALSPSRAQSQIIVRSPITGAAELSMQEQLGGSHEHSPARESRRPMRVLPCKHVAHDRCLNQEVSNLVTDDTARITQYRCSHVECGQKVFVGLSRRRKSNKKAEDTKKEPAKSEAKSSADAESSITSGIVGAGCFGSTGSSLRVNRTMHRRGRNSYTSDESGSSTAPSMDLSVTSASLQSTGITGMSLGGGGGGGGGGNVWGTSERSDSYAHGMQQQQPAPVQQRVTHRPAPQNMSGALADGLSFEVNASGISGTMPHQRAGGRAGGYGVAGGNRPPVGRRVRLRALGDAAANMSMGTGPAPHGTLRGVVGVDAMNDAYGSFEHNSRTSTSSEPVPPLGRSARRDLEYEFGNVDIGSMSDRAPSPAPLPAIRNVQRSASLGSSSQFPGTASRSAEVKANVSNILVYNLSKHSRQKNRPREPAHAADQNLVMEVMSLSNPGMVILPNQHLAGYNTQSNTQSNAASRPAGGRIIRGGLRNLGNGTRTSALPDGMLQSTGLSNTRNLSSSNFMSEP